MKATCQLKGNEYSYQVIGINMKDDGVEYVVEDETHDRKIFKARQLARQLEVLYQFSPQDMHSIVLMATMEEYDAVYSLTKQSLHIREERERLNGQVC